MVLTLNASQPLCKDAQRSTLVSGVSNASGGQGRFWTELHPVCSEDCDDLDPLAIRNSGLSCPLDFPDQKCQTGSESLASRNLRSASRHSIQLQARVHTE